MPAKLVLVKLILLFDIFFQAYKHSKMTLLLQYPKQTVCGTVNRFKVRNVMNDGMNRSCLQLMAEVGYELTTQAQ